MRLTTSARGVPSAARVALLPVPAIGSAAFNSWGGRRITGQPGTQGIPSPKPVALPETMAGSRSNQPSYSAPDVLFPSIYYARPDAQDHPPVSLFRDNEMPVPAVRVQQLPHVSQRMRRVGGQTQVGQPAAVQTWPQWRGSGA